MPDGATVTAQITCFLYRLLPALAFAAAPIAACSAGGFTLSSPEFADHGTIPMAQVYNRSGCRGGDLSPALHWSGAPAGTKSFAVTIYDPDAQGGWWHWLVFNIPAKVTSLAEGAGAVNSDKLPRGALQGRNDFGFSGYGGPCPPPGDPPHHYQITVYALGTDQLPMNSDVTGPELARTLNSHALAQARLTGSYGRTR